ncbi:MAG: BatA domain-containing protein [Bacteroidia bacterium]|nr:BatA domain-containing protein [Bacteroidia bacterium]NNF32388.1 hypothetical protein [Flavobacteriaceae bacterium]MBT8275060.1 BatA domain-containing protein [Bacteroidia bacterium]NNJ81723.1 hypothetical protein [Flavobacteriaceae bacterium]NNK55411.1 hypothetical protein [Flavobacteriaceae bacterium]
MQFKHPEVLYALFLLLIPILIHLFQLRRFQKIDFTNVAFLKKVTIQTRKSSQLKKWLTLLLRLLAIACIVLAFAQPFTASRTALNAEKETVLYIDNSFSMQAKGANGPLLQRVLQQLYEQTSGETTLSWFTNTETRKDVSIQDFKEEILSVPYVQQQLTPEEVILKAQQLFSNSQNAVKRLLYISDMQLRAPSLPVIPENITLEIVQPEPVSVNNVSIDTAYVASKNAHTTKLNVIVSGQGDIAQTVPVSLYNNGILIAKIAADLSESSGSTISYDIENPAGFNGKLELNDPNLVYDNSLYFTINVPKKIKVLSINEANSDFLTRLFNQPEFEYKRQRADNLNYNDIPNQNFLILNELRTIPPSLANALSSFLSGGGSLMIIPSGSANLSSYNNLIGANGVGNFSEKVSQEKKISQIVFAHPLFESVFEKQVVNFQYPKVNEYFLTNTNATAALRFEDSKPFILQSGNVYLSTAPLNVENSNFQSSPLIVPTFYNMAIRSLPLSELYYELGRQNTFAIPVNLTQDEILQLKDSVSTFIPLQQSKANQVIITTTDKPGKSGNFSVENDGEFIEAISYNYSRIESRLQYLEAENWENARSYNTVASMFDTIAEENAIRSFWKWFVIFAVVFLILELLVLKFYKQ